MNFKYRKYRNKLASSVFGGWVISILFDWTLSWLELVTRERLFWVCMIKNMVIGIYAATITIFIALGLGNDCRSWLNSRGEVELNPLREFEMNAKVRYWFEVIKEVLQDPTHHRSTQTWTHHHSLKCLCLGVGARIPSTPQKNPNIGENSATTFKM